MQEQVPTTHTNLPLYNQVMTTASLPLSTTSQNQEPIVNLNANQSASPQITNPEQPNPANRSFIQRFNSIFSLEITPKKLRIFNILLILFYLLIAILFFDILYISNNKLQHWIVFVAIAFILTLSLYINLWIDTFDNVSRKLKYKWYVRLFRLVIGFIMLGYYGYYLFKAKEIIKYQ